MIGIDVGGYKGKFISILHDLGCDKIYCFEPESKFYELCVGVAEKLSPNFEVVKKCLYKDGTYQLNYDDDGSSIFIDSNTTTTVESVSIKTFAESKNINHIDYIKINCEGGEFQILNDMIENDITFGEMFVQFHNNVEGDDVRDSLLKKLYDLGYSIFSHQRWKDDNYVWWSVLHQNNNDIKLATSDLPITTPQKFD
tara:strand:- start:189 stop:779 length:591 start_codon:yes stop_codon:yes gene_type:complete